MFQVDQLLHSAEEAKMRIKNSHLANVPEQPKPSGGKYKERCLFSFFLDVRLFDDSLYECQINHHNNNSNNNLFSYRLEQKNHLNAKRVSRVFSLKTLYAE